MKDFYQRIRVSSKKVRNSFSSLHNLYNIIPDTKGCMENIEEQECCGGWCCKVQTPQLLYCEFLLIWNHLSKTLGDDELCELLRKCMINATKDSPSKGCIFFDNTKKMCKIHEVRPYNCRIYGITPDKEFNERYERLKEQYKDVKNAKIEKQCSLVSTEDGYEITSEDTDRWWVKLNKIEKSIGIKKGDITDEAGGSYRAPHDHVLLYNMPDNILSGIAGIRLYDSYVDKMTAIDDIIKNIKKHFKNERKTNKS